MPLRERSLTIGRLAAQVGVNVETIRFYQRKWLLQEPDRPIGGIRHYGQTDVARVQFIKSAQRLGFSLQEIAQLLRLDQGMQCSAAAQLASRHLADVRVRLQDLHRMEAALAKLLKRCVRHRGEVACPLIAALRVNADDATHTPRKRNPTVSAT
jgi:MerR family mercuric resistance operon transcriptional regulator